MGDYSRQEAGRGPCTYGSCRATLMMQTQAQATQRQPFWWMMLRSAFSSGMPKEIAAVRSLTEHRIAPQCRMCKNSCQIPA